MVCLIACLHQQEQLADTLWKVVGLGLKHLRKENIDKRKRSQSFCNKHRHDLLEAPARDCKCEVVSCLASFRLSTSSKVFIKLSIHKDEMNITDRECI